MKVGVLILARLFTLTFQDPSGDSNMIKTPGDGIQSSEELPPGSVDIQFSLRE
jgi:hypothetical protein